MNKKLDFKALQEEWYAKLKAEADAEDAAGIDPKDGKAFRDIEYANGGIKSGASRFIAESPNPEVWEATAQYYRLAMHFLNDFKFDSKLDEIVWEYHANGISVKDISILLAKTGQKKISKSTVANIVARLRDRMRLIYLPSVEAKHAN